MNLPSLEADEVSISGSSPGWAPFSRGHITW